MKKLAFILVFVLSAAMLFTGCAVITNILDPLPDEYVDGVRVSKDYPDDQLELYDDAIVFETEEDDEEITLTYGTVDEIDDVIDFYEDMFDDNDLTVDESDDGGDEYYAEGSGDGFKFEINAEEAKGGYEERAFATVVEVKIVFYEMGEETLAKMQGFWLICGAYGEVSDDYRIWGQAIDFDGMKMDFYDNFAIDTTNNEFTFVDDDTIHYIEEGDEYTVDITFETIDGINVMGMTVDGVTIYLEKSSYDDMMVYQYMGGEEDGYIYLDDYLTDEELAYFATDVDWYLTYVYYTDGTYDYSDMYNRIYLDSVYYTGEDEFSDGEFYNMTWYIYDSIIYFMYDDGVTESYLIDFEFDGTDLYMYLFDPDYGYNDTGLVYMMY